ncbi:MAG: hypothetical protein C0467_13060 [Planctomycetaceae bacterium]|nr:hypothetical protein [Planctomycetaceae bacterium]
MTTANFASRLKQLRVQAGMTQEALADRAGLSKAGVADLEQGRREPGWATVIALANALGATCQDFLGPVGEQEKAKPGRPRQVSLQPNAATQPVTKPNPGLTAMKPVVRSKKAKKREK